MVKLSEEGTVILPATPGSYYKPTVIDDIVDHIVRKVLDILE